MPELSPQVAIIGDLHSGWNEFDVRYFNQSRYEVLLFTGDLGGRIARSIASLERAALVMLGNNDVRQYAAITAELTYQRGLSGLLSADEGGLVEVTTRTCGFSSHVLSLADLDVTLIAGRPFAMGGSEFSFPDALRQSYEVGSLDESRERLRGLVDSISTEHVVFLSHNGPTGLGAERTDTWGRDFGGMSGDWGDRDLADAVAYARERGRRPLAVIAGHMHWSAKCPRKWCVSRDDTLYVNAARVPRTSLVSGQRKHMHLAMTLSSESARVEEMWIPVESDVRPAS